MRENHLDHTNEAISLAHGYEFAEPESISPQEVIDLRLTTGWGEGDTQEVWQSCIEDSIAVVGVRDKEDSRLIGIGFLAGNSRHGIFCDFTVNPAHQRKGIGTAIIWERLRIADSLGIPYLYTELAKENPLVERYKKLGFISTGRGLFREKSQ